MGSLIPDRCNDTVLAQEAASADLCVDTFLHVYNVPGYIRLFISPSISLSLF